MGLPISAVLSLALLTYFSVFTHALGSGSIHRSISTLELRDDASAILLDLEEHPHRPQTSRSPEDEARAAQLACSIGKLALSDDEVIIGQQQVDEVTQISWSRACWLRPQCVFRPSSTEKVARVMAIVVSSKARFAMRSGGHNPNPGFSGIGRNGVLVDLGQLQHLELAENGLVLRSGPGNRWKEVYRLAAGVGRSVVGGRMPDVGVGGLVLGGGLGSWSGTYGMACDNVKNFEIVLANASIVNANVLENRELFWALKGGGANFGIVTRIDLYTVPVSKVWFASFLYSAEDTARVLDAIHAYENASTALSDNNGALAVSISQEQAYIGLVYSLPVARRPQVFAAFFDVIPMRVVIPESVGSPYDLVLAYAAILPLGKARWDIQGTSTIQDIGIYRDALQRWQRVAAKLKSRTDGTAKMTFGIQSVSANVARAGRLRGGNPMNIEERRQAWLVATVNWNDSAWDGIAHVAMVEAGKSYVAAAMKKNGFVAFEYMNDASTNQDPLASYGRGNVEKLKAVARMYDPLGVMQKLQGSGFLLE